MATDTRGRLGGQHRWVPLCAAVVLIGRCVDAIAVLVRCGVDLSAVTTRRQESALHLAVLHGHTQASQYLVNTGLLTAWCARSACVSQLVCVSACVALRGCSQRCGRGWEYCPTLRCDQGNPDPDPNAYTS